MNWLYEKGYYAPVEQPVSEERQEATIVPVKRASVVSSEPKPMPAGRVSYDTEEIQFSGTWIMAPPQDYESEWRMMNMDAKYLDAMSPKEILDMLADLSPELSRAIWDFLRLCNPGYDYKVYEPGTNTNDTKRRVISSEGTEQVDSFLELLRSLYGSVDIVFGRFFIGAYLRGAFCSELVLDGEARESIDLATPDPYSVRFRKKVDPLRGEVWQPGQWQGTQFVPLDIPTFRYLPVDPAPASPYGRPLAAPALFTAVFLLSLLHDVKRVVMQQGYKRMDIVLDTQQAMDAFVLDSQGYETLGAYIRAAIEAVKDVYRNLEPDDAFIHTDLFTLNPPAGTIDSDSIAAIATIIEKLEKMATRALKSNGLIMDTGNNPNEADSNRKWEIHAAGIKSIQHHCENMLESQLELSCRAKGIQAEVEFRFSELRASEMLRDEQTRQMKLQNNFGEYMAGYASQDEASNNQVNHDADEKEPRGPLTGNVVQDNSSGEENLAQNSDDRFTKKLQSAVETVESRLVLELQEVSRDIQEALKERANGYH